MRGKPERENAAGWQLEHSYASLPEVLHTRAVPVPVACPGLAVFNEKLALELGLDPSALAGDSGAEIFAGNRLPEGAKPIAQAYAGHQFGHFTNLGDGRAILLGEQVSPDGSRFDLQLKGAGRTPYSRRGDGRAALGPMLREYVLSEAMHALGIPTTRSLAVATTGEEVVREELLPGAVLTRIASSHIRVGTFEYAAALGDRGLIESLVDYTLQRHYPDSLTAENRALALLEGVLERQAKLVAQWAGVGFVHGVMNTDNMALSGETIDYGPCAFLDAYDPATVFSSIDRGGRYAFGNQPAMAHWNLTRLAEALVPLLHVDQAGAVEIAETALARFPERYEFFYAGLLRSKLGLCRKEEGDFALAQEFLGSMQASGADFTKTFADLTRSVESGELTGLSSQGGCAGQAWQDKWRARLGREQAEKAEVVALMRSANPVVIPRNHRVEEALAAAGGGDFTVMHRLLGVLARPFDEGPEKEAYRVGPMAGGEPYRTFCGT
jgi:serine/tyrosine/threonine adenylyltransferase